MVARWVLRPMKALLLATALLCLLVVVPAPAQAQQSGSVTVMLSAPTEALQQGSAPAVIPGVVTFTADITAALSPSGIPVTYTITKQPAWATVIVSPSTDMFPAPSAPTGLSYAASRSILITVSVAHAPTADTTDVIELTATTGAAILGKSFVGIGAAPIAFDAPDEPCPEHAVTQEQLAVWAAEATEAYNEYQASNADEPADELTVQNASASPISLPVMAIAGFALVGAGVGLLLKRRLHR